jgi:hypothetical protein
MAARFLRQFSGSIVRGHGMSATHPSYIRILCVEVVRNQYELHSSVAYIPVAAEGQKGIHLPCQGIL